MSSKAPETSSVPQMNAEAMFAPTGERERRGDIVLKRMRKTKPPATLQRRVAALFIFKKKSTNNKTPKKIKRKSIKIAPILMYEGLFYLRSIFFNSSSG